MSRSAQWAAFALFLLLLAGVCALLWHAHQWSAPALAGATALIIAGLWALGRLGEGGSAPRLASA
jgi:hypothetical protein